MYIVLNFTLTETNCQLPSRQQRYFKSSYLLKLFQDLAFICLMSVWVFEIHFSLQVGVM